MGLVSFWAGVICSILLALFSFRSMFYSYFYIVYYVVVEQISLQEKEDQRNEI